jgi:hypothetical protein
MMSYSMVLEPNSLFALGLVGADRIGRFEVVARVEQRLQHCHPRLVLAVVEGEGEDATWLQDAMCLAPALREQR